MNDVSPTQDVQQAVVLPSWLNDLPDELKQNKVLQRFRDVAQLAKAYINANYMISSRLAVPDDAAAPEAWQAFFASIGRPENPDDYRLQEMSDMSDVELLAAAKKWFHQAGLTQRQVDALVIPYVQMFKERMQQQAKSQQSSMDHEVNQLKSEWGQAYDQQLAHAQRAARTLAEDDAQLAKLESVIGSRGMLKLFARMGQMLAEDHVSGMKAQPFALTPEAARAEINKLMADKDFVAALIDRFHPQHDAVMQKRSMLYRLAYPSQTTAKN